MALMLIDSNFIVALGMIAVLSVFGAIFLYMDIKRYAPEAMAIRAARKQKKPLVMVHFQSGNSYIEIPTEENIEGSVLPFYKLKRVGLKFRDSTGQKVEKLSGEVPMYHHYEVTPEPINTATAVAFSQIQDWLRKNSIDIDGIEDLVFPVLNDYEKTKDIKATLESLYFEKEEERERVAAIIRFIEANRKELEQMKLKSGIFTYQTITRAIDATLAYTSANLAFSKQAIETWVKAAYPIDQKNMLTYAMVFVMVCIGAGIFLKVGGFI